MISFITLQLLAFWSLSGSANKVYFESIQQRLNPIQPWLFGARQAWGIFFILFCSSYAEEGSIIWEIFLMSAFFHCFLLILCHIYNMVKIDKKVVCLFMSNSFIEKRLNAEFWKIIFLVKPLLDKNGKSQKIKFI